LTKKDSYWRKHKEQSGETFSSRAVNRPVVQISEQLRAEFEEGKVLLIDKPLHWTSFDVVRKIRNSIRIRKVGHAGTLDPLATGLLIVCTGKFTKRINEFMAREKEYTGTITLGAVTPTYDLESLPENHRDTSHISEQMIRESVEALTGEIQQFPPIYSAIKKKGTPLYELARRGEEVELKARKVTIKSFGILSAEMPVLHFRIVCSTGTYIRSIANDLGAALGCGGYLSSLRRTKIGDMDVTDAIGMEEWIERIEKGVLPE
jgi:tRNA pseudouridine55 synthase